MTDNTTLADAQPGLVPANLASTARNLFSAGAGFLVGRGYITSDQATELVGVGMVLLPVIWSFYTNWRTHQALKSKAA